MQKISKYIETSKYKQVVKISRNLGGGTSNIWPTFGRNLKSFGQFGMAEWLPAKPAPKIWWKSTSFRSSFMKQTSTCKMIRST